MFAVQYTAIIARACTYACVWLACLQHADAWVLCSSCLQASADTCISSAMHETHDAMQVWGTCLGHQLQMILTANVDFNDLLITTDAVVSLLCHHCSATLP